MFGWVRKCSIVDYMFSFSAWKAAVYNLLRFVSPSRAFFHPNYVTVRAGKKELSILFRSSD